MLSFIWAPALWLIITYPFRRFKKARDHCRLTTKGPLRLIKRKLIENESIEYIVEVQLANKWYTALRPSDNYGHNRGLLFSFLYPDPQEGWTRLAIFDSEAEAIEFMKTRSGLNEQSIIKPVVIAELRYQTLFSDQDMYTPQILNTSLAIPKTIGNPVAWRKTGCEKTNEV
jgi:hypothetical protein